MEPAGSTLGCMSDHEGMVPRLGTGLYERIFEHLHTKLVLLRGWVHRLASLAEAGNKAKAVGKVPRSSVIRVGTVRSPASRSSATKKFCQLSPVR